MKKSKKPNVKDFPLATGLSNLSKITLHGRYPDAGEAENLVSEMVAYVLEGTVTLCTDEKRRTCRRGQAVLVKAKTRYAWHTKKPVTLLIWSTPPWTGVQQKVHIDKAKKR